jgi:hypothetical protein
MYFQRRKRIPHLAERAKFNEIADEAAAGIEKDTVQVKVDSLT